MVLVDGEELLTRCLAASRAFIQLTRVCTCRSRFLLRIADCCSLLQMHFANFVI